MTTAEGSIESLHKVMTVAATPEVAWRVFTSQMGRWWPLATHKIGRVPAVDAILEPYVGGRWYERGEDGSTCTWGHVLVWEPASRLVLTWEISPDWAHDPALQTEVEIRFTPEGASATRVELEHRRLELFAARAEEMRGVFDSEGGWTGLLAAFSASAGSGGTDAGAVVSP